MANNKTITQWNIIILYETVTEALCTASIQCSMPEMHRSCYKASVTDLGGGKCENVLKVIHVKDDADKQRP